MERKKSSKGETRADLRGGDSLLSPLFHLRQIEAPLFVHSFIRSFVRSFSSARLACTDLPRVAGNLDLQLEGKSIALDIQSGVSESSSDTWSPRTRSLFSFSFLFFLTAFLVPPFLGKIQSGNNSRCCS